MALAQQHSTPRSYFQGLVVCLALRVVQLPLIIPVYIAHTHDKERRQAGFANRPPPCPKGGAFLCGTRGLPLTPNVKR